MGEEEHNPLAQWEDLEVIKQAEIAAKQVVRAESSLHSILPDHLCRRKYLRSKPNMYAYILTSLIAFLNRNSECGQRPLGSQPDGHLWSGKSQSTGSRLRR